MRGEASNTAMLAASTRFAHRVEDDHPWVLDDPFALPLVGAQWRELEALILGMFPEPVQRVVRGGLACRSRYAEDRFLAGGSSQYVLLGAGLDSFVWRRPDVLRRGRVFEVDHPATQEWKQDRVEALALPIDDGPTFVPCDFERERLHDVLERAGFDWGQPACFAWIAVTMYLTVPAVEETLRTVAAGAPGTEIVLSYAPPRGTLDELSQAFLDVMLPLAESRGEPIQSFFDEDEAVDLIERCGLVVADHPSNDELNRALPQREIRRAPCLRRGTTAHCDRSRAEEVSLSGDGGDRGAPRVVARGSAPWEAPSRTVRGR